MRIKTAHSRALRAGERITTLEVPERIFDAVVLAEVREREALRLQRVDYLHLLTNLIAKHPDDPSLMDRADRVYRVLAA